ncbi:hypothetical protein DRN87_02085 [Candidatus Geothermarchaeota archaeon]|nr:MAG: hypothetical protein DRN87_02085 [Candidatus Geothermarchaeota archaeon]
MFKNLFNKLFKWIRDVKRYITINRIRDFSSKHNSNPARRQNNTVFEERLIKLLSAIATLLAYIILLLSRKYRDSIIDAIILALVIIQTIVLATIIISILKGGERISP